MIAKKFLKAFIPYGVLAIVRKIRDKSGYILEQETDTEPYLKDGSFRTIVDSESGNNLVEIILENYEQPFYVRKDNSTDIGVYKDIIVDHGYKFAVDSMPKVIIDAGANIGMASIYFANKYPEAKIIAIEPEEENYKLLEKNTECYPNIISIKAALWNVEKSIDILDVGRGSYGFMVGEKGKSDTISIPFKEFSQTQGITIKGILEKYDLDRIDILKMDIEGSEKEVLEDSSEWIGKVNSIIIELHEEKKRGCNRAFKNAVKIFDKRCKQGEYEFASKNDYIKMKHK